MKMKYDLGKLEAEAEGWVEKAKAKDLDLMLSDFTIIAGDLYVDGMDPGEWIDAMTMD